jgi:hypothetical protein
MNYNKLVRSIAKSFLLAFMGTGVFFSFLMMIVIPIQATLARTNTNISKQSVVVNPNILLRSFGVPMAIAIFITLFAVGMVRLHRSQRSTQVKA